MQIGEDFGVRFQHFCKRATAGLGLPTDQLLPVRLLHCGITPFNYSEDIVDLRKRLLSCRQGCCFVRMKLGHTTLVQLLLLGMPFER
jgi:hypothetical protein